MIRNFLCGIIIVFGSFTIYAQVSSEDLYNKMNNAFMLGLEEEALVIGNELISESIHSALREKAMFNLAEHFFVTGIIDTTIVAINKAFSIYKMFAKDYPNSEMINSVNERVTFLKSNYEENILFRDLKNYIENEKAIVMKKMLFTQLLLDFNEPSKLSFFLEGDENINAVEKANKYFDEIIVNNPTYAVYAYQKKLYLRLSTLPGVDIFKPNLANNIDKASIYARQFIIGNALKILKTLSQEYPNHSVTLDCFCVAINCFIDTGVYKRNSLEILEMLQYIVKHDHDKWGFRFVLAKEYVMNNKFKCYNDINSLERYFD